MRLSNKILLMWLAIMWAVFSLWVYAVTEFPIDFGVIGLQSLAGIVLMWTMFLYREN